MSVIIWSEYGASGAVLIGQVDRMSQHRITRVPGIPDVLMIWTVHAERMIVTAVTLEDALQLQMRNLSQQQ